jgi:hypothetical protein
MPKVKRPLKKIAAPKKKAPAKFNAATKKSAHALSPDGRPMVDSDQLNAAERKRLIKVFGLFIRAVQTEVLQIPEADAGGGENMKPVDLNAIMQGLKDLRVRHDSIEAAFNSLHKQVAGDLTPAQVAEEIRLSEVGAPN